MNDPNSLREIQRLVDRLGRRVRLQRVVAALTTAVSLQLMLIAVLVALHHGGWTSAQARTAAILATFAIPVLTGVGAWLRTVDPIALAQTLDRTHDLHDRLSTALSLGPKERNAFEEAQIRDASKHLAEIDLRRASPWQRPAEMVAFGVSAAILLGVWYFQAPDYKRPLPPELVIRHEKIMDDATLALERERLEALKQALESAGLEDSEELVQALDELLDKAERQEISEKQFLEELERIEKKYLENDDESRQDIADKLKEAAEKLEKEMGKDLAKDPEAKALVDALKNKDYEKAAEAMDALAKKLQDPNLSSKDLERLAKMMEKFSDLIDPNDPNLQKLIEENQALVDKLQKMFDQNKLTDLEKKRLNDAKKRAQDLDAKRKGNEGTLTSRQLKALQKKTKDMAQEAREAANQKNQKSNKGEAQQKKENFQQQAGQKAQEAARQLEQEGKEQQKSDAREAAQRQLEELREAMQRSDVKREQKEDGQSQEKAEKMKEFLDRAKGQQPDPSAKPGQKPGNAQGPEAEKGDSEKQDKTGTGAGKGDSFGLGQGERELREETQLDSKRVDEKLEGQKGDGPSRSEVIKSASEEGFATTEYKDVYVDYESVVEEVMEKENVPKGYRFYIKRYFQLIRPQE